MPDLKPIPMNDSGGGDKAIHPAGEKISAWMNSYMPTVMNKIMAGSGKPTSLGGGEASISKMLYEAVHPDTFNRVLDLFKPTPRQEGTPPGQLEEPGKPLKVGEGGPETFVPAVPGQVIPTSPSPMGGTSMTYGGQVDPNLPRRALAEMPGAIQKISPYLGPGLSVPLKALGKIGEVYGGMPSETTPPYSLRTPPRGDYKERTRQEFGGIPMGGDGGGETLAGWRDYTPEGEPTGIRYKYGPEDTAGDAAARARIERLYGAGPGGGAEERYGTPIPRKSYYDVHPEERFMDMAEQANRPLMDRFNKTKFSDEKAILARMMEANTQEAQNYYKAGMEFGPQSPKSQEELAHAQYYREQPGIQREWHELASQQHLEGVREATQQRLAVAKDKEEQTKIQGEERLWKTIVSGFSSTDEAGKQTIDIERAAPYIKQAIKQGRLSPDFGIGLPGRTKEEATKILQTGKDARGNPLKVTPANIRAVMYYEGELK